MTTDTERIRELMAERDQSRALKKHYKAERDALAAENATIRAQIAEAIALLRETDWEHDNFAASALLVLLRGRIERGEP